jgi:light-harvesting complex 1 beta chain
MEKAKPMDKQGLYLGNVSDSEAKEFHNGFMMGFYVWLAVAIVAHYLTWLWRPWFPGTAAYKSSASLDGVITTVSQLFT